MYVQHVDPSRGSFHPRKQKGPATVMRKGKTERDRGKRS
jgi:hypothetical protein